MEKRLMHLNTGTPNSQISDMVLWLSAQVLKSDCPGFNPGSKIY